MTPAKDMTIMASLGLSAAEKDSVEQFRRDVVEPSMTQLVVLDFWAAWCGPCKAVAPILEKVAADYATRGVVLVKIDVDANPFIAAQFRVQSIPTIYAIHKGQPVADLSQARTEAQFTQMLDQILRQLPIESEASRAAQDLAPLLAMGEEVLDSGDGERAVGIFSQIVEMAPDNADAQGGLIRALVAAGQLEAAQDILAAVPDSIAQAAPVERARAAITLAADAPMDAELQALHDAHVAAPDDMEKRFALAGALIGAGQRDAAADHLLAMIAQDRAWNDNAARTKLLNMFEVVGLEDPWVAQTRRRLSAILFG